MNFFPRSLLARTALVILVTLIATQIVTATLFRHYFSQPRQQTAAIGFASHLKSISAALETIPPERHLALALSMSRPMGRPREMSA